MVKNLFKKYLDQFFFILMLAFAALYPTGLVYGVIFLTLIIWLFKLNFGDLRFEKNFLFFSFIVLFLAYLISFLFSFGLIHSSTLKTEGEAVRQLLALISPLIWFFIISSISFSEEQLKKIFDVYWISMMIVVTYSLVSYLFLNFPVFNFQQRLQFFEPSPNYTGEHISMVCTALFVMIGYEKNKSLIIIKVLLLIVALSALFFTFSRGAWLGLVGSILWLTFFGLKNLIIKKTALVLAIASVLFFTFVPSLQNRLQNISLNTSGKYEREVIWSTGLKAIDTVPWFTLGPNKLFGIGPSMFETYYRKYRPNEHVFRDTHNYLIHHLVELGLLGLVSFILMVVTMFYTVNLIKKKTRGFQHSLVLILTGWLISWNIHGLVSNTYRYRATHMLVATLAFIVSINRDKLSSFPVTKSDNKVNNLL